MKTLFIENINSTNSSNNGNRFEIILPGNTDKGKNYTINKDCCIWLWSRIQCYKLIPIIWSRTYLLNNLWGCWDELWHSRYHLTALLARLEMGGMYKYLKTTNIIVQSVVSDTLIWIIFTYEFIPHRHEVKNEGAGIQ